MGKQFRLKISPFCNRRVVTGLWAPSVFIPDWNQVQAKKKRNQKGKVRYWLWRGGGGGSRKQASHQLELHLKNVQSKPRENELILSSSKQHSSGESRPSDKRGGGRSSHPDPEIRRRGGGLKKLFFRPFGPQFGLKKAPLLDPPLYSAYLAAAYPGCRKIWFRQRQYRLQP